LVLLWPVLVFPRLRNWSSYHNKLPKEEENSMNPMIFMRVITASVLLMVAGWSQAATIPMTATLDGGQEVPANASPGFGAAVVTYDNVSNELSWNITFAGLTTGATASHFHGPAAPGVNAGVQVTIPLGLFAGMTSGNLIGMATISEAQESQLLSELWYINIHTSTFPGGEIRGQVLNAAVIPVPAAVWLFGSGLLGLVALARRRKS
jgi:hypothetical protein